ncbi:MAG TPA: L,D-transpeptidase [Thermoanaerobaculaceae bacterium]|nr:L,D-transpeptidase [Thermoanaerobaculaceae bacterium]HRS14779.1 L,D-transpeptidase [Thermoanaerobaculaceae bacterium]
MSADGSVVLGVRVEQPPRRRLWPLLLGLAVVLLLSGSCLGLLRAGRPLVATPFELTTVLPGSLGSGIGLEKRAARAEAELQRLAPRGVYIVIDTYRNRLHLIQDGKVLRSAVCSTGTGRVLRDPRNGREWVFDTPMGERIIESKRKDPPWAKPDWAFIEEGYLPPPPGSPERWDTVSLGDYGLYMGDGYIIHGTLFKSLLGRRVTHGCVRLGDEDLEFVYKNAPLGTRVYLY